MSEYYVVLKKKGSSKEYQCSTEELEAEVKKHLEEHVERCPFWLRWFAKKALDYLGEGVSFAIDYFVERLETAPVAKAKPKSRKKK